MSIIMRTSSLKLWVMSAVLAGGLQVHKRSIVIQSPGTTEMADLSRSPPAPGTSAMQREANITVSISRAEPIDEPLCCCACEGGDMVCCTECESVQKCCGAVDSVCQFRNSNLGDGSNRNRLGCYDDFDAKLCCCGYHFDLDEWPNESNVEFKCFDPTGELCARYNVSDDGSPKTLCIGLVCAPVLCSVALPGCMYEPLRGARNCIFPCCIAKAEGQ